MDSWTITEEQWGKVNSALLKAAMVCLMHKREFHQEMLDASFIMDEIVNGPVDAED
jgi:hypothetical protein